MIGHPIHASGSSQANLILTHLIFNHGKWISMPELAELSGAYAVHSRISDLRKKGYAIEHKNEHAGRVCKSFYRIT